MAPSGAIFFVLRQEFFPSVSRIAALAICEIMIQSPFWNVSSNG